jgi:hypothetical protein
MTQVAGNDAEASKGRKLFSPMVVLWLVLIGAFSFSALLVLQAYAPDRGADQDPGAHGLSRSAVGYSGMVRLLNEVGRPALVARGRVTLNKPSVVILTIDEGNPKTQLRDLPTTRGFKGPILAVLPKWETAGYPLRQRWVRKDGVRKVDAQTWIGSGDKSGEVITLAQGKGIGPRHLKWVNPESAGYDADSDDDGEAPAPASVRADMVTGPIDRMQVFTVIKGWTPLIVDEVGNVVLARHGQDNFYALSEPDLLNNQGIANLITARAGVAVLDTVARGNEPTFLFDVTLNGFARSRSLFKLAFEPPFVAATLCAFFAILLGGWGAFNRFGAERRQGRVFALGKRALADNQAGLIRMAGREHRMAVPYVHIVRDLVARAVGAPRELSPDALDAFLERIATHRGTTDKLVELTHAATLAKNPADLSHLADRLHQWRLEMTGQATIATPAPEAKAGA